MLFLRKRSLFTPLWAVVLLALSGLVRAEEIELIDDNGRAVVLKAPARRLVTLSSQITELVFAAGGGDKIVATVSSSDYPPAAQSLPRIGDGLLPDPKKIAPYKPDLIIGWLSEQLEPLEALNIPLFASAPDSLAAIADSVENFGILLGTSRIARPRADMLRQTLDMLAHTNASRNAQRAPVRVFIQTGAEPQHTLGGDHLLSDVIAMCGGVNVFAESASVNSEISADSVLTAKPDFILVGRAGAGLAPTVDPTALAYWRSAGLGAARNGQVFMMDENVLYRPGPRLIEAAGQLCDAIERSRK
jgi:iron complex transport system substrate-binding protein/vitamin B12 transport system substrate-binding protein